MEIIPLPHHQIKDKTKENLKKAEQRDYNVRILDEEVGMYVHACTNNTVHIIMIIDHVNQSAKDFNKTTNDLNRAECCRKYKVSIGPK